MLIFRAESMLIWCGRRTNPVDFAAFIDDVVDIGVVTTLPFPASTSAAAAFCETAFAVDVDDATDCASPSLIQAALQ